MISGTYIANMLFLLLNKRRYKLFLGNSKQVRKIQHKVLLGIIKANKDTHFGLDHKFAAMNNVETFQNLVPVNNYEFYKDYIAKIMKGETNVLTGQKVNNFVPTSGTSSPSKYIPYTKALKNDFTKQINVWIYDLLIHHKKLKYCKQFWIVSPASKINYPESAIPIGFEADSGYLGFIARKLVRQVLIVPDEISQIKSINNYYYTICTLLLAAKDVGIISVWNPTMLIEMLKFISANYSKLIHIIKTGKPELPDDNSEDCTLSKKLIKKDTRRAKELEHMGTDWKKIWPRLQVISCWTNAWAKIYIDEIHQLFPGIPVQGKGLLATEGIISIPLAELNYPLLTYNSHFYEFREIETQRIYLAHELEADKRYELIITTNGGLYRYNLYDIVKVKDFYSGVPMLEFAGRSNRVSDFTGEKLSEIHVTEILDKLINKHCISNGKFFLKALTGNDKTYYGLFIDESILKKSFSEELILTELENELCKNYHYYNSKMMKQLGAPKLFCLPTGELDKYLTTPINQISTRKDIRLII